MNNRVLLIAGWIGSVLVAAAAGRFGALNPDWDRALLWAAAVTAAAGCTYLASWWALRARAARGGRPSLRAQMPLVVVGALLILFSINYVATKHTWRWDL